MKRHMPKHNGMNLLKRRTHRAPEEAAEAALRRSAALKYDDTTGQVFEETIAVFEVSGDLLWAQTHRKELKHQEFESAELEQWGTSFSECFGGRVVRGARSLQDAAVECVLQNISDVTLEGIECLPIQLVKRIWDQLHRRSVS
jgi:hypothetical protein